MSGKETDFPKAVPGKLEKLGHHLLLGPKELTRFTKREIKDPFAYFLHRLQDQPLLAAWL